MPQATTLPRAPIIANKPDEINKNSSPVET
jgi:hypothetical protein